MSDCELPAWSQLHRPARRVIELPDVADRVLLACHEAGHAVALRAFGLPIFRAELLHGSGRVLRIIDTTPADDAVAGGFSNEQLATLADVAAVGHAATTAAGPQAEMLARYGTAAHGLKGVTVTRADSSDARRVTAQLAHRFDAPLPLAYCQHVARAILCRHWAGVESIARHLYRFGTATGATIDNLLAEAGCTAGVGIDWALSVVSSQTATEDYPGDRAGPPGPSRLRVIRTAGSRQGVGSEQGNPSHACAARGLDLRER